MSSLFSPYFQQSPFISFFMPNNEEYGDALQSNAETVERVHAAGPASR